VLSQFSTRVPFDPKKKLSQKLGRGSGAKKKKRLNPLFDKTFQGQMMTIAF